MTEPLLLLYDEIFLKHETDSLEHGSRLQAIVGELKEYGLWEKVPRRRPRQASRSEVLLAHPHEYLEALQAFCAAGGGVWAEDTVVDRDTYDVALRAVGAVLDGIDAVMKGVYHRALALVRPPGHHAAALRGGGFCVLNNLAIGANYARQEYWLNRIAILDWDAHHGNGLQSFFYSDSEVLYISLHQDGLYPYTGWATETGDERGKGFNINIPLPKDTGDTGYYYAMHKIILPVLEQFQPQLLLVAAGYDAHFADPLSSLALTSEGFGQLAKMIKPWPLVAALEGGYDPATVGHAVAATVAVWGELPVAVTDPAAPPYAPVRPTQRLRIDDAWQIQKKYWRL
ncbi:Acetoin utilization deacetylase AcuC [Carboxydocella sporoproducens DSM 16521]|uniref:Acetoin utilization deacetylase AcuC n=2 Tax=Carboxydocella TaxID=178898 RepID=A0A1T4MU32_9FIRM|nr:MULTISPECIES: histone deacetylase [Carboxydocella]AVX20327.1 Acetoin utilization deacetylase AcuC [Carboxydocella thermautotrophica]SJZ70483.1 Acetoin utilization deacetylase AcuC [Carboxydocella sporoproducens DSM 16521]